MWKTQDVPGIGKRNDLPEFVKDLTPEQLSSLSNEAQLSIKYLSGERYKYSEITKVIKELIQPIKAKWEVCGSYRRKLPTCKDIDLLVLGDKIEIKGDIHIIRDGQKRTKLLAYSHAIKKYVPIDIYYTTRQSWPYSLLHLTGSKEFNIKLRRAAIAMSKKLNEYILTGVKLRTEKDIIEYLLGYYVPPEKR